MNEKSLRRKRFETVAARRIQKILELLNSLSNCSNRNNYEYNEKDVELMFREINKSLKETKAIFDKQLNKSNKTDFKF